jgi:uncharacterized protein (TIGR03435 family)
MRKPLGFAIACGALLGAPWIEAQPSEQLKWEVISVKPMSSDSCRAGDGGVRFLPNGLSAACVPVVFVVEFAYHLMDPARIVGLPKWAMGSEAYAIEARVSGEDAAAFGALKRDEKASMMQSVFAKRFGFKAHMEAREMPAYALAIAKGGPKLKSRSDDAKGISQFGESTGEVKWVNSPLTDLKFLLGRETGRPVVDHTGLTGKYDFVLEYTPSSRAATSSAASSSAGTDESGRPSIFTALEEQLGLKLVPLKQAVEVLVVDSIEQPSEN